MSSGTAPHRRPKVPTHNGFHRSNDGPPSARPRRRCYERTGAFRPGAERDQPRQRVNQSTFVRPARRQPGFAPLVGSGRSAQAQSFGLRAPSRPVRHARSFNGPVRRRRLRGQHREVPSVPAGARDEHTIEQEESGGGVCCDCPGVLLVASAAALLNHAARLDRRALHTLQGPPRAARDTV